MKRNPAFGLTVFTLGILFGTVVWGKNCYVDNAAGGNTHSGTSWATAWTSWCAITGISAGDTVYISGGSTSRTYADLMYHTQGGTMWLPVGGTTGKPVALSAVAKSGMYVLGNIPRQQIQKVILLNK